jgi:hypothetical protein
MHGCVDAVSSERPAYLYRLTWKQERTNLPWDVYYGGCRFANGCSADDLWTKYFTSSKLVREFVKYHGDPDTIETVLVSVKRCGEFEHHFLVHNRAAQSPDWLNRSNGLKDFVLPLERTPEHRAKIGAAHRGKKSVPKPAQR